MDISFFKLSEIFNQSCQFGKIQRLEKEWGRLVYIYPNKLSTVIKFNFDATLLFGTSSERVIEIEHKIAAKHVAYLLTVIIDVARSIDAIIVIQKIKDGQGNL